MPRGSTTLRSHDPSQDTTALRPDDRPSPAGPPSGGPSPSRPPSTRPSRVPSPSPRRPGLDHRPAVAPEDEITDPGTGTLPSVGEVRAATSAPTTAVTAAVPPAVPPAATVALAPVPLSSARTDAVTTTPGPDRVPPSPPSPRTPGIAEVPGTAATPGAVDPAEATEFVEQFHAENPTAGPARDRVAEVLDEIGRTGTYVHTTEELAFGARVAWRNSARCIGRLYWRSLHLRDRRHVTAAGEVAEECVGHLREATRRGRIRSTITVFAPDTPAGPGPRIWNEQLVRYAGYRAGGSVLGDPQYVGFTDLTRSLGWLPPSPMGRFDVLPLVVTGGREHASDGPQLTELPADAVLEVPLTHPDHAWFADLGLRWHAVPAISNMHLDVGGIRYPTAPFNGWYMATEIGARNLADADRYDVLRDVAEGMGLDTSSDRTLWRDRAAVELTLAVQHSYDTAGVTLADHHGESQRFLRHLEREEAAGRSCPVDWSWIVPPISGGLTPVFHRYYDPPTDSGPMLRLDPTAAARGRGCPA